MKRSTVFVLLAVVAVLVAVVSVGAYILVSRSDRVSQAFGAGSEPTPATSPPNASVKQGCDAAKQATTPLNDKARDPVAMDAAGQLVLGSTDSDIRYAGNMLIRRAELAKAAKGSRDEAVTTAELQTAAMGLATACIKAGF